MKKLIICSDGTWDEPTGQVSNVVKLACALRHCLRWGIYRLHRSYRCPVGSRGPELEKIHPSVSERVERCGLGYEVRGMGLFDLSVSAER